MHWQPAALGRSELPQRPEKCGARVFVPKAIRKSQYEFVPGGRDDVVICERYSVGVVCEVDAKPLHADTLVDIRALRALNVVRDHDPRIAEPQKQVTPLWV